MKLVDIARLLGGRRLRAASGAALASLALTTCAPGVGVVAGTGLAERVTAEGAVPVEGESPSPAQKAPTFAQEPQPSAEQAPAAPPAQPAVPVPEVAFDPIQVRQPRLQVSAAPDADVLGAVLDIEGVSFATAIEVGRVPVTGGQGPVEISVAAVDPAGFRVLTPQVTADHVAVWQRIVEGDAAFTHDAGHRLEVPLGNSVPAGRASLRIGAYASNGVPPVADAIVSHATAEMLGLQGSQEVLVALDEGADAAAVGAQLAAVTDAEATLIDKPVQQHAFLTGAESREAFEPFTYIDYGDGMISIDPEWVQRNIVSAPMPILTGNVNCHRLIIDQLRGALQEIVDAGLSHLIDPTQYGGCWVPRHIDFDPSKILSMHAWGLAVDLNVSTNGLGQAPQMDPRIVEIFDRWGFNWGGRWSRPDGMHFELGALLSRGG